MDHWAAIVRYGQRDHSSCTWEAIPIGGRSSSYSPLARGFRTKEVPVLVILICVQVVFTGIGVFGTLFEWQDGILFWSMFLVLGMYLGLNRALKRAIQCRSVMSGEN